MRTYSVTLPIQHMTQTYTDTESRKSVYSASAKCQEEASECALHNFVVYFSPI